MSIAETVSRHLEAFSCGDVAGLLADYADDAVVLFHDKKVEGHDAIGAFFGHVFTAMFPGGLPVSIENHLSAGDVVYLKWQPRSAEVPIRMGTDTLVFHSGKIAVQTVAICG